MTDKRSPDVTNLLYEAFVTAAREAGLNDQAIEALWQLAEEESERLRKKREEDAGM